MSDALVEALNVCGWRHSGDPNDPRPDDPALLTTLVAHATPEQRRAVLAMLKGWEIDDLVEAAERAEMAGNTEVGDAVHVTNPKAENDAPNEDAVSD